jgi:catechol-2,3-dioxygenase
MKVRLAHVVYRTSRPDVLVEWYSSVLGTEVVHANPFLTFLTFDEEHHRIALIHDSSCTGAPSGPGVDHVAYTLDDLDQLVRTYERLAVEGIQPYWAINHGMTLSLYYRDPDKNQIELQVDLYGEVADSRGFMHSPAFASNPIGETFDPDELAAQVRAGATIDQFRLSPL